MITRNRPDTEIPCRVQVRSIGKPVGDTDFLIVLLLADLQDDPDRLRRPVKRTATGWQEIDWDTAFAEIGARMAGIARPGSVRR